MTYPQGIFTTFAFLGFLTSVIPLPWHFEAWNTGTCLYMIWTATGCLNLFVNSIVWRSNAINWAPVWCDISSRIIISVGIAIPAASLCINRRLYHIASVRSVTISKAEKRRDVIVDLAIGLGIPILYQICYYINQGHRFNIFEDLGCWPFTYNTWVAYVLMSTPPLVIGLISGFYAIRSIIAFNKSRTQFNDILSNHSNLTSSRYLRLMCLGGIEVLGTVPFCIVGMVVNYQGSGLQPWISWEDTHWGFSRVDQVPAMLWRSNPSAESQLELCRWMTVVCAFIFFGFFGFADEARCHYRLAINSITKTLGISSLTSSSGGGVLSSQIVFKSKTSSGGKLRPGLPVHVHKEMYNRDSILSIDLSFKDALAGGLVGEKNADEKSSTFTSSTFAPTLSYGAMTLNDVGGSLSDVGGTLPDYCESPISPVPSSGPPSPLSTPTLTRENSLSQNIEISSLRYDSIAPITPLEKAHTSDVV